LRYKTEEAKKVGEAKMNKESKLKAQRNQKQDQQLSKHKHAKIKQKKTKERKNRTVAPQNTTEGSVSRLKFNDSMSFHEGTPVTQTFYQDRSLTVVQTEESPM
jgi:hypothetical protein